MAQCPILKSGLTVAYIFVHHTVDDPITYAAGKDAKVVIWIVKRARDEHKQAIEWLNQNTEDDIGFFLIEIELWKIGDSLPATKFNVVERPNDWAKTMKAAQGLSDLQKMQVEYWQAFNDYAFARQDFANLFSKRKPSAQHWYDLSIGSSTLHIGLTVNTMKKCIGTEIYFNADKNLFEKFKRQAVEIESELGTTLIWREATKDCRILTLHKGDIKGGSVAWKEMFQWYCEMALQMRAIAKKYGY